ISDVTYTVNANTVTVGGTVNCQVLDAVTAPAPSTAPLLYLKKGWPVPVNVPVPSGFATVTVPVPPVTLGPLLKNTLTPPVSAVVPSAVFIGTAKRLVRVTFDVNRLEPS